MRRGSRGRGYGGGSYQSQNNIPRLLQPQQSHGGPLMTDHLQGLKDIDMELELLKKKREIIEQQQQMLSNSYRERNDFNEPMYESRENRFDDYSRLYDNPTSYSRPEPSRKRPHIPVWDNELPAKRFSGPRRPGLKNTFESRRSPAPMRPNFPRTPAAKPIKKPPPPPSKKKDFNSSKPKLPVLPAKLATWRAEQKAAAAPRPAPAPAPARAPAPAQTRSAGRVGDEELVLRVDREPTHLMVGRLELALGAILKDLKTAHGVEHARLFTQGNAVRAMKQFIRERIRTAMMGKVVTAADPIKAAYLQMYPAAHQDVIDVGLRAYGNKSFLPITEDNPETYFRKNMKHLMSLKLEEMIKKLQEIYGGPPPKPSSGQKDANPKTEPVSEKSAGNTEKDTQERDINYETVNTKNSEKYDPFEITEDENHENKSKELSNDKASEIETVDLTVTKNSDVNKEQKVPVFEVPKEMITNSHYVILDKLLTSKMPHLLKKFAPQFVKLMEMDPTYQTIKNEIVNETMRMEIGSLPPKNKQQIASDNKDKTQKKPIKYYVKIMGKPNLPKRKPMESFFSEFQPKLIKKHRTVHNLLFVGFCDQEPFERILAANGTIIGRNFLDIKTSERNDNKKNQTNQENTTNTEVKPENEYSIGSDLDEQITDLLTSIRNSEELANEDVIMKEAEPIKEEINEKDEVIENTSEVKPSDETSKIAKNDTSNVEEIIDVDKNAENDNDVELIPEEEQVNGGDGDDEVVEINDVLQNEANNDETQQNDAQNEVNNEETQQNDAQNETKNDETTENEAKSDVAQKNDVEVKDKEVVEGAVKDKEVVEGTGTPRSVGVRTRRMTKH